MGAALLAVAPRPAGAQTTSSSSSTTTTSTSAPVATTTTSTSTTTPQLVEPTTTTTVPGWTIRVPGPPAPPPLPPSVTPAQVAQAAKVESEIVGQSAQLDVLADQYDEAQQTVQDTASEIAGVTAQVATAKTEELALRTTMAREQVALRQAAVDAYINGYGNPSEIEDGLVNAYVEETDQVVVDSGLTRALALLGDQRQSELHLQALTQSLLADQDQAGSDSALARAAAQKAQIAAQAAGASQVQLQASLAKISGNMTELVAAAETQLEQATYRKFVALDSLDFVPSGGLSAPISPTAAALQAAMAQLGKPYVWGADGPNSFDCSGLMQWAWAQAGVHIPRVAADQQAWATPVPISQLQPGDFVFFGDPAHHVGMYIGNGMMVNAPYTGADVDVVPIWQSDLAGFGRVPASA